MTSDDDVVSCEVCVLDSGHVYLVAGKMFIKEREGEERGGP